LNSNCIDCNSDILGNNWKTEDNLSILFVLDNSSNSNHIEIDVISSGKLGLMERRSLSAILCSSRYRDRGRRLIPFRLLPTVHKLATPSSVTQRENPTARQTETLECEWPFIWSREYCEAFSVLSVQNCTFYWISRLSHCFEIIDVGIESKSRYQFFVLFFSWFLWLICEINPNNLGKHFRYFVIFMNLLC